MPSRSTRPLYRLRHLAVCALVAAPAALADQVVYGPDGAPTVVQHKLYTMTGRSEVGLSGAVALNTALVDHYGALLSASHHPNEWLDVGGDLLVDYAALSGLTQQIRGNLPPRADSTTHKGLLSDEVANADQLRGAALIFARIAPIYGKLNLASELNVHFQAFVLLGGGAALVHHESVNLCATAGQSACATGGFQTSDSVKPAFEVGGGLRLYLTPVWSLRTEVRAFLHPATYREAADLTAPESGTPHGYLGLVTMFAAGVSRIF